MTVLNPTMSANLGSNVSLVGSFLPTVRTGGNAITIPTGATWYRDIALDAMTYVPDLVWGTGSLVTDALLRLAARRSTGTPTRILVIGEAPSYLDDVQPTSEVVNTIRVAFGLSVTDMAGVLGVERPTVYSWLNDRSTPSPARLERMALVLRLADTWTSESGGGVSPVLTSAVGAEVDLLTALKNPKLWENEIIQNLRAQAAASKAHGRRNKLVAISRGHRADPRSASDFDIATARPLSPEL